MAGEVRLGDHGERAAKPGQLVAEDVAAGGRRAAALRLPRRHQARQRARRARARRRAGATRLDVGASTGGFTDCLLQRGAAHVVALDVAYGELDWRLRTDERVTVLERRNARALDPAELPYRPDLVVADVSFISLAKVLPAVLAATAPRFDALAMVKPQFEVGRERVGKGGVVREAADRRAALVAVAGAARAAGAAVLGFASSGLPGPEGQPRDLPLAGRGRARRGARATTPWRRPRWRSSREERHRPHPRAHGGHRTGAADARRPPPASTASTCASTRGDRASTTRRRPVPRARRARSPTTWSSASCSGATGRSCARCAATRGRASRSSP